LRIVRAAVTLGSPPRAWGQFTTRVSRAGIARFTPTGVGTMIEHENDVLKAEVHPHGRGDNARGPRQC